MLVWKNITDVCLKRKKQPENVLSSSLKAGRDSASMTFPTLQTHLPINDLRSKISDRLAFFFLRIEINGLLWLEVDLQ